MEYPLASVAVLPFRGVAWLCRCCGPEVVPLVEAPGAPDARYAFAPDGSALAVLDTGRKRSGLFKILDHAPWAERALHFTSLPMGCLGHAVATCGKSLIVGGHSGTEESLWCRSPRNPQTWQPVRFPVGIGSKGKAIDGILIDGSRVIAVDDLLSPKWVIVYRLSDEGGLNDPASVRLPDHIAYERIQATALGSDWLGLISMGNSHGSRGSFISLLAPDTFQEQAVWSVRAHGELFGDVSSDDSDPISLALLEAKELEFIGDTMLVACGERGLLSADLAGWTPAPQNPPPVAETSDPRSRLRQVVVDLVAPVKAGGPGPLLVHRQVPDLARVDGIVVPTPSDPTGAFITGLDEAGALTYSWVPRDT